MTDLVPLDFLLDAFHAKDLDGFVRHLPRVKHQEDLAVAGCLAMDPQDLSFFAALVPWVKSDKTFITLLLHAAAAGVPKALDMVLSSRAVDPFDAGRALQEAATTGQAACMELLLDRLPDTNTSTALSHAVTNGHLDCVRVLIDKAPQPAEVRQLGAVMACATHAFVIAENLLPQCDLVEVAKELSNSVCYEQADALAERMSAAQRREFERWAKQQFSLQLEDADKGWAESFPIMASRVMQDALEQATPHAQGSSLRAPRL